MATERILKKEKRVIQPIITQITYLFFAISFCVKALTSFFYSRCDDLHKAGNTGFGLMQCIAFYYVISGIYENNLSKLKLVKLFFLTFFIITCSEIHGNNLITILILFTLLSLYTIAWLVVENSLSKLTVEFAKFYISKYGISTKMESKLNYN